MVSVGRVIANKYRIESQLGRGGMGSVWRAHHLTLGSDVAIKFIDPKVNDSAIVRRRFLSEAKAAARLRGPHVVQIFDHGIDGDVPFIVMELLIGETLGHRLARDKTLSPQDTALVLTHVGRAIQNAHQLNIVHRDLKPENIFLVRNEDELIAKVLDFGVAKVSPRTGDSPSTTATGVMLGSPCYMSPEQAHGGKRVDYRADLWAMSIITFECLTGRLPFQGKGWGELISKICRDVPPVPSSVHEVPEGFDEWFERATRKEPTERFPSCREMLGELRAVLCPVNGAVRFVSRDLSAAEIPAAGGADTQASERNRDFGSRAQTVGEPLPHAHSTEERFSSRSDGAVTTTLRSTTKPDRPGGAAPRYRWLLVTAVSVVLVALAGVVASRIFAVRAQAPDSSAPAAQMTVPQLLATDRSATGSASRRSAPQPSSMPSEDVSGSGRLRSHPRDASRNILESRSTELPARRPSSLPRKASTAAPGQQPADAGPNAQSSADSKAMDQDMKARATEEAAPPVPGVPNALRNRE